MANPIKEHQENEQLTSDALLAVALLIEANRKYISPPRLLKFLSDLNALRDELLIDVKVAQMPEPDS